MLYVTLIILMALSCKTDVSQESSSQSVDPEITSSVSQTSMNDSIEEEKTKPISSEVSQSTNQEKQTIVEVKKDSPKKAKPTIQSKVISDPAEVPKTKLNISKKKSLPKIKPPAEFKPKLFFPDTLFNFGFIDEGDTISHTFRFLNDGKDALEILDVQVSCGCTIPIYPLESIGPGRLGKIDVTFLSAGKIGSQVATIDVLTNAENPKQKLYLKGVVR